jgi:hypothetical protein
MRNRWSKEKVFLLLAAFFLGWAVLKLGLELARPPAGPMAPAVRAPAICQGDPDVERSFAPFDLASVLERGHVEPIRRSIGQPPPARPDARPDGDAAEPKPGRPDDRADGQVDKRGREDTGEDAGPDGGNHGKKLGPKPPPKAIPPPPFTLVAVVRTEGPDAQTLAVLRHHPTATLYRAAPGDLLPDGHRLGTITDDAVILRAPDGKAHRYRGRFDTQYGN